MSDVMVPEPANADVQALAKTLGCTDEPAPVAVSPIVGAEVGNCFGAVKLKVAADGGEVVYGWCFWLFPEVWVEAEFHAVWRGPDGALLDVTPKRDGENAVVFVPDPKRVYEGRTHNSVHRLILDEAPVRDCVKLIGLRTDFVESRGKPGQVEVELDESESDIYREIIGAEALLLMVVRGGGLSSTPCPCASGDQYGKCHHASVGMLISAVERALHSEARGGGDDDNQG
jgi:hypothetical protein